MRDQAILRISSVPGLRAKIARELGVTRPAILKWRQVPAERLPDVERITGIPRHELRPDICPPPCAGR
jgi:DNA-binding transcriptional regulator YdaS (Cro superfamily)